MGIMGMVMLLLAGSPGAGMAPVESEAGGHMVIRCTAPVTLMALQDRTAQPAPREARPGWRDRQSPAAGPVRRSLCYRLAGA